MKLKSLLPLFIILVGSVRVLPQKMQHIFYSELHVIPSDSINTVYFTYRIPYDRFIFTKKNNNYVAEFRMSLEVFDSTGKHITRQIQDHEILTDSFHDANSKSLYKQDVVKFNLPTGDYKVYPILMDLNVNREIHLHTINLDLNKNKNYTLSYPIVINSGKVNCSGRQFFDLTNFNSAIPFSENKFNIIIPDIDSETKSIKCIFINKRDTILSKTVTDSFPGLIKFDTCNNNITLKSGEAGKPVKNFLITNFSTKLKEGKTKLVIIFGDSVSKKKTFPIEVIWINKPFSLREPEQAVKYLNIIGKDSAADKILSENSKHYSELLFNYWKKYDPTPETEFNPVMDEFYTRIDYASKNFAVLGDKNGITTDRGKIFIQYGKPSKIERTSNQYGQVVEAWIYQKPKRKFVFIDKEGTGDFKLEKG